MKEALCRECQKSGRKSLHFSSMIRGAGATTNSAGNASMGVSRASGLASSTAPAIYQNEQKGGHRLMNYEFMITGTPLPPCMPLPRAALRLPVSSTAKVMYARLLDDILTNGLEDSNGLLFFQKPPDLQTFPERAGTGWYGHACPSGRRGGQPHVYPAPKGEQRL